VLIVGATVIGIATALTTWVDRQLLDEQSWRTASAELIEDPAIQDAVATYLVNELYAEVDVTAALQERLPPDLRPLAGTVAGALREPATDAVERLLATPRVQQLWIDASSLAQQKLVAVLENTTEHGISTGDGTVTLDLGELVTELGTELGISQATLDRIPPDAGVITVMRSDQLATAQAAVQAVRVLSAALLVLVLALYALAVYLARGERRRVLRDVGWALVLAGLVVLAVRQLAGRYVVDALTSPTSHEAGRRTWILASEILAQIGWAVLAYGAVITVAAVLAGPTRAAVAVRSRIAPVLNEQPGVAWGVVGAAYLLLVLWGPTYALRTGWGIIGLAALIAAGVLALRHQTLTERPLRTGDGAAVRVTRAERVTPVE
jgi:hypothetical protein